MAHAEHPAMTDLQGSFQKLFEDQFGNMQRLQKGVALTRDWEVNVGQTPHEVVFQEGKIRLLHYKPQTKQVHKTPLLIVFSLINRSYILDLKPGKSIVESMVKAGYDVYLIDWGVAGRVNRYLDRVISHIQDESQAKQVSILGYCMGGTMAAMYTALHQERIANLLLLASPIDFSEKEGLLYLWTDKEHFKPDKLVEAFGNIPPWLLQSSFNMVKPVQNLMDKYVKFFDKLDDERFVDDFLTLEYWLNDNVPLAGLVYQQFVEDCFHNNLLIQNKLRLGAQRVNLEAITCPTLSIVATQDHLVPNCSSVPLHKVIKSDDKEVISFPAGHIGLSISGRAMTVLWPNVANWLAERSGGKRKV
jgi:polyhydroxyalkanoate synthase subunit PhaC